MQQVDEELAEKDLSDAVPKPRHWRWTWAVAGPLLVVVAAAVVIPAASGNAFWRWATPWLDVERYTFAQLEGQAESRVVPYAEPFHLAANLLASSPWQPAVAQARYSGQPAVTAAREGLAYRFSMPPQTEDGAVELRVGDARRSISVQPKERPALTDLRAHVELPAYLERREPVTVDVRGGTVRVVEGSKVSFSAIATRELAECALDGRPQVVDGTNVTTEQVGADESAQVALALRDNFGLTTREPQLVRVDVTEDRAPTVVVNELQNGMVVLSTQVLTFEVVVVDDYGAQQVGFEWQGIEDPVQNPEPQAGEKLVAAGGPEADSLKVRATFSAEREGLEPQSLQLRAYTVDYLPGRQRVYSEPIVVHILTPEEHLKWLTEQLSQWAESAMEVYDTELQLNQKNEELQQLSEAELAQSEVQAELQEQAAAESANAAKLETLVEIGKQLLQEAAKNEEFDAEQLEQLAELLKKLEEVAGEQMPSVAELLAMAAEPGPPAPPAGQSPEDPPLPGEAGEVIKQPEEPPSAEDAVTAPPGGKELGLEKKDKYGPDAKDLQGLTKDPKDPNSPGGDVLQDQSKQPDGKPGYIPANPTPLVIDIESTFMKPDKAKDAPQLVGGLGIPGTTLEGSGNDPAEQEDEPESKEALVLKAVKEQQDLLDAFYALSEQLNALLIGFENATLVKRLKAASRRQIDIAAGLNGLNGFGVNESAAGASAKRAQLARQEEVQSEKLVALQHDLAAYVERKPTTNLERVLGEMLEAGAASELRDVRTLIEGNRIGQSTIDAEFWSDTFDRWAEQLVDPLPDVLPEFPDFIEAPNLPPAMVLEAMRIIDAETQLREETREVEQARPAMTDEEYSERAEKLAVTQRELASQSRDLASRIEQLPNSKKVYSLGLTLMKHADKLTKAATVMDEAEGRLASPDTGSETIAAIAEVIEILLESHRIPNAPMVVKAPPATLQAMLLGSGMGNDADRASIEERAPQQATGKAGRKLPEEYRQGLDAYLNALEGRK